MDWLASIGFMISTAGMTYLIFLVFTLKAEIHSLRVQLDMLRIRRGTVNKSDSHYKAPHVDARARTTVRDTDDLPHSGRMGPTLARKNSTDAQSPARPGDDG